MTRNALLLTLMASVAGVGYAGLTMIAGGDRSMLLIGETTDAHHQFEIACETCHVAPAFADSAAANKALNKACVTCHEDELKDGDDNHPVKLFRGPRMAAFRTQIDARFCTSCHIEHRPEITLTGAVTVPLDFCVACHSEGEQDVRRIRESHADLGFDTCATAGCHNYHDNRALYEDFLVAHADDPWLAATPIHELSASYLLPPASTESVLGRNDAVAPAAALSDPTALDHWVGSGHAAAGINCTSCHAPDVSGDASPAEINEHWTDAPTTAVCATCHKPQAKSFVLGRHGMRQHPELSEPRDFRSQLGNAWLVQHAPDLVVDWLSDPPLPTFMTAGEARLPMRPDSASLALDCGTCHQPHSVDRQHAQSAACLTCHNDSHSQTWAGSPHHALWLAEQSGDAPAGSGVSCATCHMPKVERRGNITTNHNQNDNLRPNEKMIRSVCLDCHGLGFALDALADRELIIRNFTGMPETHIESIDWAKRQVDSDK